MIKAHNQDVDSATNSVVAASNEKDNCKMASLFYILCKEEFCGGFREELHQNREVENDMMHVTFKE